MRMSDYFIPTLKERPADAELVSHRYMLRAGLIRRLTKGVYSWLPLGLRVLRRVEAIVREEMQAIGALEMLMPMVQPAELWQETGRWELYGAELLRFEDRHQHASCLGPTHEEVITALVRDTVNSYKQLPLTLFQIQTKFRDEIRPRFGVMRAREFVMKDAYSFHLSEDSLTNTYDAMRDAYRRIFERLGLNYRVVLADSGAIGGALSHEFHVLADSGEDTIVFSDASDYAANLEKACSKPIEAEVVAELGPKLALQVETVSSITALAEELDCQAHEIVQTLLVRGAKTPWVALLLCGDDTLNPLKAEQLEAVATPLQMATADELAECFALSSHELGPGLQTLDGEEVPMLLDHAVAALPHFSCGGNQRHLQYKNAQWGRDYKLAKVVDLRLVKVGDPSPDGAGSLQFTRGIEIGHIFQLQAKYTAPMQAKVLNAEGKGCEILAGCYGIGVSRIVAAAIEQQHDDKGIIWPSAMAPFSVHLLPLMAHKSYRVQQLAEQIYHDLQAAGIDVLWEDQKLRPGVMLAQADLLGIPHRLVLSERGLDQQSLEYKSRTAAAAEHWPIEGYLSELQSRL